MRKSIRYQYTLIFAAVITVILFSIWFMNNSCLENYYIRNKEGILRKSYAQIGAMLESGEMVLASDSSALEAEPPGSSYLRELTETYNISILIVNMKTWEYLSTEPRNGRFMEMQMMELYHAQNPGGKGMEIIEDSDRYTMQKVYNNRSKATYLQSYGHFDNEDVYFIMSLPLSSIQESVAISNRFMTILSLMALLLGSFVIFITTKRVAEPILGLSRLSEQMSELNFNVKYTGAAENEIGVLGNSMNALSDRLKETMGELKSANLKLQADIEQKIKIDEMRKNFISNVSHELKTPLTIIHGYAEGLNDGMCRDEESRNFYYQVIMSETDKMTVLVRQLLNLSDLEFGFDTPQIERFDLTELVGAVLSSQEMILKEKEAEVLFSGKESVYVWADEFKIEEVLNNYLTNALNHLDGAKQIRIGMKEEDGLVTTTVFNTGKQIPEEDLEKLWSKFYKVDKARTRKYGGSGIGLSIVKAIMDSHHRECGVRNMEDGVEFWFTLDSEAEGEKPDSEKPDRGKECRESAEE